LFSHAWVSRAVDTELDRRQAELGEQLAAEPPHWALEAWGVPPTEAGGLRDDWMQRAVTVQGYRELAGITDPAMAIGPAPARQAGISEAFAASVRALAVPDEAALLKAMGRGELEARIREYARAEAVAPADVQAEVSSVDRTRDHFDAQARAAAKAGDADGARFAEEVSRILEADRKRLRVADAARREWTEATANIAEAAEQARAELDQRGPGSWEEVRSEGQAETGREVQVDATDAGTEVDTGAEAWREAHSSVEADVDPDALTVMARVDAELAANDTTFDDNLARAKAGAERLAEQRARGQAERDRAAVDEPVTQATTQVELDAAAVVDKAEASQDADLDI
jgi:hypothetical protein